MKAKHGRLIPRMLNSIPRNVNSILEGLETNTMKLKLNSEIMFRANALKLASQLPSATFYIVISVKARRSQNVNV